MPEVSEYEALGQSAKALALVRDYAAGHKENAIAHVRLSRVLLSAGMGGAALTEGKAAAQVDPKSEVAWLWLASVYQHDTFGRLMEGNWNPEESEKCFRKALELEPDNTAALSNLASLLEHNSRGWQYAQGERLEESIALYRKALEKQSVPEAQTRLSLALLRARRLEAAKQEAKKCTADVQTGLLAVISALQDGAGRAIANAQAGSPIRISKLCCLLLWASP
jgi:tetratricopeptide (TPR) repeat protein